MSKKGKQLKTSRKIKKALQREEDAKDGDLKNTLDEVRKARAKPASIGSRIVLREDAASANPTPGFSDFVRKKHKNSPTLSHLPTDDRDARSYAIKNLRANPKPTQFWLEQQ